VPSEKKISHRGRIVRSFRTVPSPPHGTSVSTRSKPTTPASPKARAGACRGAWARVTLERFGHL
jgi:hypothetical protein